MQGFIKLYRRITEWEWYNDINTTRLFIHLLLTANHREQKWQGLTILPGQKITSYPHLAAENTLSVQAVRTSLNKLKSTGEITVKTTSKYSLITIQNWTDYQIDNIQSNSQATGEQQASNRPSTTNKNVKNDKNEKNIYIDFNFFQDEPFKNLFNDYLEMRKRKRKPPTEKAEILVLKELHKYPLEEAKTMLENSIKNSWTDVYPINKPGQTPQRKTNVTFI